jgi:hypothetical protein
MELFVAITNPKKMYERRVADLKASFVDCEELLETHEGIIATSDNLKEIARSQQEIQRLEGLLDEYCTLIGEANKKIYLIL